MLATKIDLLTYIIEGTSNEEDNNYQYRLEHNSKSEVTAMLGVIKYMQKNIF